MSQGENDQMNQPWFRMHGSVLRFRPVHRNGWIVVLICAALELALMLAVGVMWLTPASRALAVAPILFMPVVAGVMFLIVAARVERPERS